ncbi:hypothetical protein C8R46DRAFT_946056 [Mycena filopes]|nr:hypothetical protein C8R46DRAFT_946056 [Mycena filopes]
MPSFLCSQCDSDTIRDRPPLPQEFQVDAASPGTRRHVLLTSNEAPLDSDVLAITFALKSLDDRLEYLDDEILRLRGELERVQGERASALSRRVETQQILSALRRMPPEILGHIFALTLQTLREAGRTVVRVKESPWSLSHVSRYWRAVALSESSLWSMVALDYEQAPPVYPLQMVETQVGRAKKLKVHFYGCETSDPQVQIETFRLLAKHAPQWEELSVGLTSDLCPLLSSLRDRLPVLCRVFLQSLRDELPTQPVDCFQSAPSLVDARVAGRHLRFIPVLFPAHQLTRYQSYSSSWDTHADILKQTLNLVEARITFDLDDNGLDGREIVNLNCLRRLFVSHAEILQLLRFPVLEEITIEIGAAAEGPSMQRALQSAISHSSCVLRRLCFWGLPLPSLVTEILGQFPSIVDFAAIIFTSGDSHLIETLMKRLTITAGAASGVVAPKLRHISFACEEQAWIAHDLYEEMIASRWRAGDFASSDLLVTSGPCPTTFVLARMAKLCDEGFNFRYLNGPDAADTITFWTLEPQWK